MGDANMPVWGALVKAGRSRLVAARHDGAAVLMADGYAKAYGKLAVTTVTCGPGLANFANALLTAARAETPLVVFTGETEPHGKGTTQYLDQRRFAQACDAHYHPLDRLDSLAEDVAEGFYLARTRSQPRIRNLPAQHWGATLQFPRDYRPSSEFLPPHAPAPRRELLEDLTRQLAAAKRPVLVAGRGALQAGVREQLERLGDQVGALLATSLLAKGFFDGRPQDVGIAGSFSSAPTERLLAEADFVLGVGASLNFFTTEGGLLFPQARIARIDSKPHPAAIGVAPGFYLQGDAAQTVGEFAGALERLKAGNTGFRTPATQEVLKSPSGRFERPDDGLDPRALMDALGRGLPAQAQVVIGAGHFWAWPSSYLALPPGGRFHHTAAFGSIGLSLAQGIGAAIACPERMTVVVEGDGGLLQAIQELHAAAALQLPIVILVMNDSAFGADVLKMRWKGRDPQGANWQSPDFVALARGFGGEGVRLDKEEDLVGALAQASAYRGPFVIDARVSPTTVNESYAKLYQDRENRAPLLRPPAGSAWKR